MSHAAELSIVVVASNLSQVAGCVESLTARAALDQAEILLVGSLDLSSLQQRFPRLVAAAADPAWSLPRMRAAGLQKASGPRVAVLSEDYRVSDDWAQAIVGATEQTGVLVGEVVPPTSGIFATACYLWEYLHLAPSTKAGRLSREEARWVPAGAAVYVKSELDSAAISVARSEMDYHQALFDSGVQFHRVPELRVRYAPATQEFLADRLRRSREWARARSTSMPLLRRWLTGLSRLALPLVLPARFIMRALVRPRYWLRALVALPFAVLFAVAETAGEVQGYFGRSA